ncbi:putative Ras-related protein Rab-33 [Tachypleus tridentatus]|uniref:putative Ras-related protein Rab-33 n=1 Tax=Tachypleus tridentatus TaxID=6853 RepID=UPI003FD38E20
MSTNMSKAARQKPTSQMMVSRKKEKQIFKIIVIGDSGIGKTCLTYRFCSGMFPAKTEATIGVDFRERIVEVEGEEIKLQLWDTAGQERFRKSMVQHYYRNVHAVVFVYDVTKIATFESLPHWIKECEENQLNDSIPRIIVGNKCDCKEQVVVNLNMAQKFADFHSMPVFETSAKDDSGADHVEAIFMTLAQKLKNSRLLMPPSPYKQVVGGNGTSNFTIPVKKSHCAHKYSAPTHSPYEEEVWCAC